MMGSLTTLFLVCQVLLGLLMLLSPSSSLPLCTDLRAPLVPNKPLTFCGYNGSACCDSSKDMQLQKQFQAMNISDEGCASLMKSILCATCDPFSAELFKVKSGLRPVPILCNSDSGNSSMSKQTTSSFCSNVWDECQDVFISNSPFAPSLQGRGGASVNSSASQLTELWQSKSVFCDAFGGSSDNGSICFDGETVSLENTETIAPPKGLCLEKISNGSYINMVAHPDGSNRAFFSSQAGKIWLGSVPEQGSGGTLELDESDPFVDLTDLVLSDPSAGMMGMAFHPNFAHNGRFFASYNCDKVKSPTCSGRCSCNSDVNCDPSKIGASSGVQPCQYHAVVAEFTANGTSSDPSLATSAKPSEVRRIFTMGLPFTSDHGGQILFGPADGYLYLMMGDGGSKGDPYNFAQNKKSLLGKIMRLDIDNIPNGDAKWRMVGVALKKPYGSKEYSFGSVLYHVLTVQWKIPNPWCTKDSPGKGACFQDSNLWTQSRCGGEEIDELGLWGNYSAPQDNPYSEDKELEPEIWALGLRNPWRCSFDSERPEYFLCGDVGQDQYEEVDIITKAGNYGWRVYEGPLLFTPEQTPGGNTSTNSINPISPILGYKHSDVNKEIGSAAMTGGYFYRSMTDPCMYGSYLYGDLYAGYIWAAAERPEGSGNFNSSSIPFSCASDSPIPCGTVPGSSLPALGYIYSFSEDNRKDIFILTSNGVYRAVRPSRCSYTCSKENVTAASPSPPTSNYANQLTGADKELFLLFLSSLLLLLGYIL